MKTLALLGEFAPDNETHIATDSAIRHSCDALSLTIESEWVSTAVATRSRLRGFAGIWVAPGSPYKDLQRTLDAIRHARETGLPCFGTCGGFQHMVLEYARHVLGIADAQHAEYDPTASNLFLSRLACSLAGRELKLSFVAGSGVAQAYGAESAVERYYCNFGVNPEKRALLVGGSLEVTGSDEEGEVRVIELTGHPFFVATLYIPQIQSRAGRPHPLVNAFLRSLSASG